MLLTGHARLIFQFIGELNCTITFLISQARVHATEDDERLQKKQRQEAIMAQFKAKYDFSKIFNVHLDCML